MCGISANTETLQTFVFLRVESGSRTFYSTTGTAHRWLCLSTTLLPSCLPDNGRFFSVDTSFDSTYPTNMVVYNTGDVHWVPPGIFKISCKIDIEWFPFDEQRCKFKVRFQRCRTFRFPHCKAHPLLLGIRKVLRNHKHRH